MGAVAAVRDRRIAGGTVMRGHLGFEELPRR